MCERENNKEETKIVLFMSVVEVEEPSSTIYHYHRFFVNLPLKYC